MQFHLNINTGVSAQKIDHQHSILLFGSCFTEHIAKKLEELKFKSFFNPFGIVFNPKSIDISLTRIVDKLYFTKDDIFESNEEWRSLETHSSLAMSSHQELLNTLNTSIDDWHLKLKTSNWLIFTFGSAFYYEYIESQKTVANCHKLPGKLFNKHLGEVTEMVSAYNVLIQKMKALNPKLAIMFTVSPVKHLRDGIIENNLSKAILIQTVHAIIKHNTNCFYFPAYELVNDDLRDYRFYEADMAHPNKQAIDYVWNKFSGTFFDLTTQEIISKLYEINLSLNHKPLNDQSNVFKQFKSTHLKKCMDLKITYPYLDFEKEIHYFS